MGVSLLIGNGLNRCNPNGGVSADELIKALENKFGDTSEGSISKSGKAFPLKFEAIFSSGANKCDAVEGFRLIKSRLKSLNKTDNNVLLNAKPVLKQANAILTTNYDFALERCLYGKKIFKTDAVGRNRGYVYQEEGSSLPPVYHIHGDIFKEHVKNLCLGFLGYQKYQRSSISNLKQNLGYYVDLDDPFSRLSDNLPKGLYRVLTDDVYIVGFGLDECELVLWGLLTMRKELIKLGAYKKTPKGKQNKILFYDSYNDGQKEKVAALKKYYEGFRITYKGSPVEKNNYSSFYARVFEEIRDELDEKQLFRR